MKQEQPDRAGGEPKRIRIQPCEIKVPQNNPFENDRLGRQEPAEILTHLLGSLEGPCVLAVDAMWETAKPPSSECGRNICARRNFPLSSSMPGRQTTPEIPSSRSRLN